MTVGQGSEISAQTRFCAVLGYPVRHSASPAMQNAGFAALGLRDWRYLALEVRPEDLAAALGGAKVMGFLGLNLTVPHKLLALDLVDVLDDSAAMWGAVNTVRYEGQAATGQWTPLGLWAGAPPAVVRAKGFNTDADALARSLREDLRFEPRGARVLVLGAGGAGRVAALKLASQGVAALHLVNRTADRAEQLAREIRDRFPGVSAAVGYPADPVDLVLNATSLGLSAKDELPLDVARFDPGRARLAYDMIYRPAETPFLCLARERGCAAANGLGMLLYQGTRALELWTGQDAPAEVMKRALMDNIYGRAST